MRSSYVAMAIALAIAWSQAAEAQRLVYTPINPSFGGSPFNSSHLLGIANSQNNYKDPSTSLTPEQQFAKQLQSRLLSALSNQVVSAIFGKNAQDNGTITYGDQQITWLTDLSGTTVTITDTSTGESTIITVPSNVSLGG